MRDREEVARSTRGGYAVWKDTSQMMRKQERSSLVNKRETRNEYLKRLKEAVTSLPKTFTDMAIDDMSGCCRRLCKARGGHFEEGGLTCVCVAKSRLAMLVTATQ